MTQNFKPMRSVAPDEKEYPIIFPVLASFKLDGIRIAKPGNVGLSKSGKPIANRFTQAWVDQHLPVGLDAEFIVGTPNDEDVYGRSFSAYSRHEGEPDFKLYVFDVCNDLKTFAIDRRRIVRRLVEATSPEVRACLVIVEQTLIKTREELDEFYRYALDRGYEGMITVRPDGQYKYGRSTAKQQTQLKWKPEADEEGIIRAMYEGMTNLNEQFTNEVGETVRSSHQANKVPNGMLGGFTVERQGVVFNVAPGKMKHPERVSVWQDYLADPSKYLGRLIKYKTMDYGTMTNGAARHGRWIGWVDPTDVLEG